MERLAASIRPRHVILGLALYGVGVVGGSSMYQSSQKKSEKSGEQLQLGGKAFDGLAEAYDNRISTSERMAGILGMRKKLLSELKGPTLEVAAGTGRNLEYYPKGIHVTLTDTSEKMLEQAKEKARQAGHLAIRLGVGSAQDLPFAENSFMHVVDTFGLCSMPDPKEALMEMRRVVKPEGDIRLIEHGRSHWGYSLLNKYLDSRAETHIQDWGCEWNRDISGIIKETPGLEIVEERHHHLGTTYEYILRKVDLPANDDVAHQAEKQILSSSTGPNASAQAA
mmetsp:Transcript_2082/g.4757  ORF Transcript_2082/g.4757 Transcript_2082/m.4757 type:complete len:281 (+) Transcript_2082:197-1039(+)|eukprot:CAMPEP_0171489342 /NCGR_PEP_ID=MMETSP0958-20121227/2706_1 /TAXON_ID=87120 /ORGANISM="Aurantiochytrium limacinum, Strain ATCCMYA-1381" /LENGTH=280 /DNA_ID=CAMNT_0012022549 /DNA_START=42 /DNA_END=884 /DNA_ORIENTATION=-